MKRSTKINHKPAETQKRYKIPLIYGYYFVTLHQYLEIILIGRDNERRILQDALTEEYSQFIAVYGQANNPRKSLR